jgi:hypothetical protein
MHHCGIPFASRSGHFAVQNLLSGGFSVPGTTTYVAKAS